MGMRRKKSRPVDRAVAELEQQIAEVQRQLRHVAQPETPRAAGSSSADNVVGFVKEMLTPNRRTAVNAHRPRADLFDVGNETLKELETDGIVTASPAVAGHEQYGEPLAVSTPPKIAPHDERLMHYLNAGTFRGQRPIKRIQRQQRNRFFMWIGLSFVALWLLYVVIR